MSDTEIGGPMRTKPGDIVIVKANSKDSNCSTDNQAATIDIRNFSRRKNGLHGAIAEESAKALRKLTSKLQ